MSLRVKICGVTSVEDATPCVELGADYLGLNFYPPSPRCLDLRAAGRIARAVEGRCRIVAVVAGASQREVSTIMDEIGPDLMQFHGDETMEQIEPWADRALKVVRVRRRPEPAMLAGFQTVWGYLLDSRHETLLGGSGTTWRWDDLAELGTGKPVFVAGGIGPETVRRAVTASRPFAVDVCSGVESEPGRKSRQRLERLFEELRFARQST